MSSTYLDTVFALLEREVAPLSGGKGIGLLRAHELAVDVELDRRSGGEDDDVAEGLLALGVVLRAEVDGLLILVPVGLVGIECILAYLAVVAYQTLVVHVVGVALTTHRRGEVEHVPDECAPQVFALLNHSDVSHVRSRLLLHGVPIATGRSTGIGAIAFAIPAYVLTDGCACTILADAEFHVGVLGMPGVEDGGEVLEGAVVPACILVPTHEVGDEVEVTFEAGGCRGQTAGVEGVGDVVEFGCH